MEMPGPRGFFKTFNYGSRFRRNYLIPMDELFKLYGDYVGFKILGYNFGFVFHPDGIEHILKSNAKNYVKTDDMREMEIMLGKGLVTSEGEEWRHHRQLIGPEFQAKKNEGLYPIMQKHIRRMLESWTKERGPFNIAPHLSRSTYGIAGECFFGADLDDSALMVYHGIEVVSNFIVKRMSTLFPMPMWLPLPSHRRIKLAVERMDALVFKIIDDRLNNPSHAHDILTRLTRIQNASGKPELSVKQIRDEVITLLLAGHETTANALAWTLYLLARHQKVQQDLRDELNAKVSGDIPTYEEIRELRFTRLVLEESMRLFPPVATIGRKNIEPDSIQGFDIPKGTNINLSQWVTHRHPDFWFKPDEFIPERFSNPAAHHQFAYFPFAAGMRECIGKNMALLEGVAYIAAMVKNYNFRLADHDVRVRPLITLRPDPGLTMFVQPVQPEYHRPDATI